MNVWHAECNDPPKLFSQMLHGCKYGRASAGVFYGNGCVNMARNKRRHLIVDSLEHIIVFILQHRKEMDK